jgi:outer membrane protein assembly factor BamB
MFSNLRGVLDVLVDGTNVTARIGQDHAIPLLRDLAYAAADLAIHRHTRATVRFYDQRDAWALGLERVDNDVLVTVFQAGEHPHVVVQERRVLGISLLRGIMNAIESVLDQEKDKTEPLFRDLDAARRFLESLRWQTSSRSIEIVDVVVEAQSDAAVSFSTEFSLRVYDDEPVLDNVERNELHSLLFTGPFHVRIGDVRRDFGNVHPFLIAECLLREAVMVLQAWESGSAFNHRRQVSDILIGIRLTTQGILSLTLGGASSAGFHGTLTFPSISVVSFVEATLAFSRGLVRPLLRHDRSQRSNLRMRVFREDVRSLSTALREVVRQDAKLNRSPESYRAFAASVATRPASNHSWGHGRLRFHANWQAAVPGVDLQSVFLFGDRLVAAGSRELASIDKQSGRILWRVPIERGVSVAAPHGIVRLSPRGFMHFHDLTTGEISMVVRLAARNGGLPAGAIVNVPGLPRLLIVSEGEKHITAVDYVSGEVRWRHTLGRGRSIKVRRAGKLLVVTSSDQTLTALDVSTGETVWRVRDKLRFTRPVSYDRNDLFAVSGDGALVQSGIEKLHAFDPWTGETKWIQCLDAGIRSMGAPLTTDELVVVALHHRRGLGLCAFDRNDGEPRWRLEPGFAPTISAWLLVDDLIAINCENGMMLGLDWRTGTIRWRHTTESPPDGDAPRNLDPVLRSGALFLPQRNVIVVRPTDGERLGEVEADLVPDLIRVDDACNVVVVEESGHVAAFSAGARLTLIKN